MTISEDKKSTLLELIKQLENELSRFVHNIENDSTVPDDAYKAIDHNAGELYHLLNQLSEEIIFS
jgi:hypothetical protein